MNEKIRNRLEVTGAFLKLGAMAVGGPKMKLQKACIRRMFETKGTVLDPSRRSERS